MASEITDFTTGIARLPINESCLPRHLSSEGLPVFTFNVVWVLLMLGAGLQKALRIIGIPVLSPPIMPPELLVLLLIFKPL